MLNPSEIEIKPVRATPDGRLSQRTAFIAIGGLAAVAIIATAVILFTRSGSGDPVVAAADTPADPIGALIGDAAPQPVAANPTEPATTDAGPNPTPAPQPTIAAADHECFRKPNLRPFPTHSTLQRPNHLVSIVPPQNQQSEGESTPLRVNA